ncbi:hypothetical protein N7488_009301 [Penicillium malachiteum]|nr:hypothetical protein N7488_009301 [Penicillium malachiteum]
MQIAFQDTRSAFACGLVIFLAAIPGCIGAQIATVRCVWAFARDGALPFSDFFSKVDEYSVMPARANILISKYQKSTHQTTSSLTLSSDDKYRPGSFVRCINCCF